MADPGAQIVAGILAGILGAMQPHYIPSPPGTCDSAGRCYPWYGQYPRPVPPPYVYPPPQLPPPREHRYRPGPEEQKLKQDLLDFCDTHAQEDFCQEMHEYMRKHPEVR